MKKLKFLLIILLGLGFFASCEDEVLPVLDLNEAIAPELTAPFANTQIELLAASANEMIEFAYNKAEFGLQLATANELQISATSDFAEKTVLTGTENETKTAISVSQVTLNKAILKFGFEPMVASDLYVRVRSYVLSTTGYEKFSEVVKISVIPYKVNTDGTTDDGTRIYMIGAAVPAGWNPTDAVEMVNIGPDKYRATTTFSVERFRFFGQKDWGPVVYNFPYFTGGVSEQFENARQPDREDGDENFWFKGEPGQYIVTVDLDAKTVTAVPVAGDGTIDDGTRIYIVGAAVPAGWNPVDAVEMKNIAPNVYRATTTFSVDRFRFIGQKDWGPVSYNFPYFTGSVSSMLENARQPDREDGDENLWFKGTPGVYVITVDLENKTITMEEPTTDDGTRIYIVGAAVPAGWNPVDAVEMKNIAPNKYRATTTFSVERFRFIGQKDWGPVSYNFPYFTGGVSSMLENARQPDREDGDENLWFKGTPGQYVITVDLENKTVTMQ